MSLSAADHRHISATLHEVEQQLGRVIEQVSVMGIRQVTGAARNARQAVRVLLGSSAGPVAPCSMVKSNTRSDHEPRE
jgi:hypothetical protein